MSGSEDGKASATQGRYPTHMAMLDDVFRFRYDEVQDISRRFHSVNDVIRLLDRALEEMEAAEIAAEDKAQLKELFEDERNVISFSLSARGSVVRL